MKMFNKIKKALQRLEKGHPDVEFTPVALDKSGKSVYFITDEGGEGNFIMEPGRNIRVNLDEEV